MRKIFPIVNLCLLYVLSLSFLVESGPFANFIQTYLLPAYFPVTFLFGILSIIYAFYLYKRRDEKNLRFAMGIGVFGILPHILMIGFFWLIISAFAAGYDSTGGVILIGIGWLSFLILSNGFYGYNLARMQKRSLVHKICHFIIIANLIVSAKLLRRKAD